MDRRAFRVTGRVQGVGYRAWTARLAGQLGVRGWVRNVEDGAVEGRVAGAPEVVERFVTALHQGPRFAQVSGVRTAPIDEAPGDGFDVLPTAGSPTDDWG